MTDTTETDISTFVRFKALPLVIEFTPQTAKKIFSGVIQAHLLMFMPAAAEGHADRVDIAREVAKDNEGRLLFVTVDTDVADNKGMLDFFGIKEAHLPSFRAIVLSEDMSMANTVQYKPDDNTIEVENIRTFVKEFLAGNLKPHRKSEDIPEDWDKNGVKVLVGYNFGDVAMDVNKDVLVEFYAPWCGHCKDLAPTWDKLGEKYKDHETVLIAKIDATANELDAIKVQGFPTIKLFKKETNEVVDFNGERTFDGFIKFLEGGAESNAAVIAEAKAAAIAEAKEAALKDAEKGTTEEEALSEDEAKEAAEKGSPGEETPSEDEAKEAAVKDTEKASPEEEAPSEDEALRIKEGTLEEEAPSEDDISTTAEDTSTKDEL